ncbi:hypothetical protein BH09BAC1_BH09BAC1_09790 [soil metagenome]
MGSLRNIFEYISQDSPEAAKKVKVAIQRKASTLSFFPDKFSREDLLDDISGNYRFTIKWSYKIIYEVEKERVSILLVVHSHQSPQHIQRMLKG